MLNRRQDDDQFWRKNIEPYYWGEYYFDHQYFGRIRVIVRFPPTIDVEPLPGYGAHGLFLQFRGRSRIYNIYNFDNFDHTQRRNFINDVKGNGDAEVQDNWRMTLYNAQYYGRCLRDRITGLCRRGGARKKSRRRKRRRKTKRKRKSKRFKKGTKSKTHKGKDFETRKTSKNYNSKRWKRITGRRTRRAPIFPFI